MIAKHWKQKRRFSFSLGTALLVPALAFAGIEEHSPIPTAEEWELIMLDDEFWDGVDEARDQSSESDPSTALYSTDPEFMMNEGNSVGDNVEFNHPHLSNDWGAVDADNHFKDDLDAYTELKKRLATVGLDLMSEEELKALEEDLDDIPFEEPSENQANGNAQAEAGSEASYASTSQGYGESDDEDDDGSEDTAEKESGLEATDSYGDGYDDTHAVGCTSAKGPFNGAFLGFIMMMLLGVRRTQLQR